jgi:hypothetical protein
MHNLMFALLSSIRSLNEYSYIQMVILLVLVSALPELVCHKVDTVHTVSVYRYRTQISVVLTKLK